MQYINIFLKSKIIYKIIKYKNIINLIVLKIKHNILFKFLTLKKTKII